MSNNESYMTGQNNDILIAEIKSFMKSMKDDLDEFKVEVRKSLDRLTDKIDEGNQRFATKNQLEMMTKGINGFHQIFATKDKIIQIEKDLLECKDEYLKKDPYKKIIDGLIATALISLLGAVIALVIK
jgi:ElaB/YqjD/DUF883 family membrane-anchored ribosome-binding protein